MQSVIFYYSTTKQMKTFKWPISSLSSRITVKSFHCLPKQGQASESRSLACMKMYTFVDFFSFHFLLILLCFPVLNLLSYSLELTYDSEFIIFILLCFWLTGYLKTNAISRTSVITASLRGQLTFFFSYRCSSVCLSLNGPLFLGLLSDLAHDLWICMSNDFIW